MEKIYLIPWYKHTIETSWYRELIVKFEEQWYEVEFIEISWKYKVMSNYITQADEQIKGTEDSLILGFSFWAMISLKIAEKYTFQKVILCSLSPYFSEDLALLPLRYKLNLWIRRWIDFGRNYSENNIQNAQWNQYTMIYGWVETQRLQARCWKMIEKLNIDKIWIVDEVGHDIADETYQKMILQKL